MQFLLDNLIASLVAMTLGLAMIAQGLQNRQASMERQAVYQAKAQSLVFGEWLEDDVVKLGARFGRERRRFLAETETIDGRPYTRSFEFYYHEGVISDDDVTRVEIKYELFEDDSVRIVAEKGATRAEDVTLQTYRLVRSSRRGEYRVSTRDWVGADPAWEVSTDYRSPAGLRYFYIEPRDSNSQRVPDERSEEADYARIEFVVTPSLFPLYKARIIPKAGLHWATTIEIRPF